MTPACSDSVSPPCIAQGLLLELNLFPGAPGGRALDQWIKGILKHESLPTVQNMHVSDSAWLMLHKLPTKQTFLHAGVLVAV